MKKLLLVFIVTLAAMIVFLPRFADEVKNRPIYGKLGYVPKGKIYKAIAGEFRWFLGEYYTFKSITYFGTKVKSVIEGRSRDVEYYNLYKTVETAVILNPYHEDAYYFAQAVFTWGLGRVREVNRILEYVFKYRSWDFQIPFFLGFNYGYFLKDYNKAAEYFKIAAELSNVPFYATLSARYFYESGRTELGIVFLEEIISKTRNESIRKLYERRLKALKAIYFLEQAVSKFRDKFGKSPENINDLLSSGIVDHIPEDPYGGKFYLDEKGKVRTTSKMTDVHRSNKQK